MVMAMSERERGQFCGFVQSLLAYRGPILSELKKVNVSADKAATHYGGLSTSLHVVVAPLRDHYVCS